MKCAFLLIDEYTQPLTGSPLYVRRQSWRLPVAQARAGQELLLIDADWNKRHLLNESGKITRVWEKRS